MPRTCGLRTGAGLQDTDKFIYIGPSWAAQNYESPESGIPEGCTNLAKEWGIPCVNRSRPGKRVLACIQDIKNLSNDLPVVWIYGEPSFDLEYICNVTQEEFVIRDDWKMLRQQCNQVCLDEIANLNRPILLIGAHSDITDCAYDNITVGHPSYQKFLAKQAGLLADDNTVKFKNTHYASYISKLVNLTDTVTINECWGVDIVHKTVYHGNNHALYNKDLVNCTADILNFWQLLENQGLFYQTHPTKKGVEMFAKETKDVVLKFLEKNT